MVLAFGIIWLFFLSKLCRFEYTYVIRSVKAVANLGSRLLYSSMRFSRKYCLVNSLQKLAWAFYVTLSLSVLTSK